jgi:serine protease Do
MVMKQWMWILLLIGAMTGAGLAQDVDTSDEEGITDVQQLAIAEAVKPSLVIVEYTLKYDKGEDPVAYGTNSGYFSRFIIQERPFEVPGCLLDDSTVMTADLVIHPRFIESIHVRLGEARVEATPSSCALDQAAMFLTLSEPLEGATPLTFAPEAEGPYQGVVYTVEDGEWTIGVSGVTQAASLTEEGVAFDKSEQNLLITDSEGNAVGVSMSDRMPIGDGWQGSPLEWEQISESDLKTHRDAIEALSEQSIVRVQLSFRSPRKRAGFRQNSENTKLNVTGILLENQRVLILEDMRWYQTRYLETIKVFPAEGDPIEATFEGSLADYGAIIAKLDSVIDGALHLSDADIRDVRMDLLMLADVDIRDDNRVAYFAHSRVVGYYRAWQNHLYPYIPGDEETIYLFNTDHELVAFPIARRMKTSVSMGAQSARTVGTDLLAFLNDEDLTDYFNPHNIPLSEDDENRVAWMGLKLQALDEDLARDYQVSELTQDGQTGGIVTFVYPDSPAALAGVEEDWILLRIHVDGQPRPLEIDAFEWVFERQDFPWEQFDVIPTEQFETLPSPWAPVDVSDLIFQLTDLGYGTVYEAEFFVDGEIVTKEFEVVESPVHYETAARYENEDAGLTVRDMTFEVAEHLRRELDEGGVVISKVEPGSKASVAGLKPYEVILEVNGQTVTSVEQFEQLIADQPMLDLNVLRRHLTRPVKLRMPVEIDEDEAVDELEDLDALEDLNDLADVEDVDDEMTDEEVIEEGEEELDPVE